MDIFFDPVQILAGFESELIEVFFDLFHNLILRVAYLQLCWGDLAVALEVHVCLGTQKRPRLRPQAFESGDDVLRVLVWNTLFPGPRQDILRYGAVLLAPFDGFVQVFARCYDHMRGLRMYRVPC